MLKLINSLSEKLPKDSRKLYLIIIVGAFLVRLVYVSILDNKWYFYDTVHYDKAARSIVAGEGFGKGYTFSEVEEFQSEYGLPPAYPVFLAALYYSFGQNFFIVRVIQSILGALICLLIFLIGRDIFNKKTAFLATLASAVYPMFIFASGLLYVETLFTFFTLLTVWFLLRFFNDRKIWQLGLVGLFLGLATLSRPILFALYPFLGLWLFMTFDKRLGLKICSIAIMYLVTALTLMPWTVRNYMVFGRITPVSAAFGWYLSNVEKRVETGLANPDEIVSNTSQNHGASIDAKQTIVSEEVKDEESSGGLLNKVYRIVMDDPKQFFSHYFGEFIHFWALYPDRVETENKLTTWAAKSLGILTFGPILLFFIFGAYYSFSNWQKSSLLFFTILSFAMGSSFFLTRVRYRIPIEPYMIIFAAYGFLRLLEKLRGTENQETY